MEKDMLFIARAVGFSTTDSCASGASLELTEQVSYANFVFMKESSYLYVAETDSR
jgi:hypothetical protein